MATNVKRKKKAEVMADDGNMTLTGHLKELRNRLIVCAVVFVVAVVVTLSYADRLIDLLTAMGQGFYTFVSIAPQEKLMQYFRVSLLAAVVVTVPVALYQVYAFAKPGLKKSETFFLKLVILLGLALFVVGVMFAYKLMMPFMLQFLSTGIEGADYIQTTTSIESYVSLCLTMFIIFGCVFEMPLVTIILAKMGIANPQLMKKGRGIAIVLIFFVAAVVTPPDIVSQCMVAIPMVLLYFVSTFLSGIFYKPRTEEGEEEDPRAELVQQLLEYKMYKYMSYELRDRMNEASRSVYKEPTFPREVLEYRTPVDTSELLSQISLAKLHTIYKMILKRQEDKIDPIRSKFGKIEKEEVSLPDKMTYVEQFAVKKRRFSFRDLLESQPGKVHVIVTFLAILELMKTGKIRISQEELFGDILIESLEDEDTVVVPYTDETDSEDKTDGRTEQE